MSCLCDECGKKIKKVYISGDSNICRTCYNAEILSKYLRRMENIREKYEQYNKLAYRQCRELSAWLSVYRFGNNEVRKEAARIINAWGRHRNKKI